MVNQNNQVLFSRSFIDNFQKAQDILQYKDEEIQLEELVKKNQAKNNEIIMICSHSIF